MEQKKGWCIDEHEWYPVYILSPWPTGSKWEEHLLTKTEIRPIQISDENLAFIERAFSDFDKAQDLLFKIRGY